MEESIYKLTRLRNSRGGSVTAVDGFGTDNQLPHSINWTAFLLHSQVRINEATGIEQVRR